MAAANQTQTPKKNLTLEAQRQRDRQKVTGLFKDYEVPGGNITFCFRAYKDDPVEKYTFHDGKVYTVPLGVARHLNTNCWYPRYDHVAGDKGVQDISTRIVEKVRRFGFSPLDFMKDEDIGDAVPSALVNVEMTPIK